MLRQLPSDYALVVPVAHLGRHFRRNTCTILECIIVATLIAVSVTSRPLIQMYFLLLMLSIWKWQ